MKIAWADRRRSTGWNMTPMIDVVFLLVIFFLVSSHLARQETQMQLPLPEAAAGLDDHQRMPSRLTINVTDDGRTWLLGQDIGSAELEQHLARAVGQHGENVEVRIRASRHLPYGELQPIMLACTRAGIWNVSFAVYREGLQ